LGEYKAVWPKTGDSVYSCSDRSGNKELTAKFFKGDELLFEKIRNDYRVPFDGFVVEFLSHPETHEPIFMFHQEHGKLGVYNMSNELLFTYKAPDFIERVSIFGEYLLAEEWIWHPVSRWILFHLVEFMNKKFNSKHVLFCSQYWQGVHHLIKTPEGLKFVSHKNVANQDSFETWEDIYKNKINYDYIEEIGEHDPDSELDDES